MARLNRLSDQGYWNLFYQTAPTSVVATPGNGMVSLSWTAPGATYAPPTLDYIVQYSSDSGSTWTQFTDSVSTGTSTTVTGLTNGTSYIFRVAATNGLGQGAWSATSASVVAGGDQFFSSVQLLLHADGADGSTSFTDFSGSPKTLTAYGDSQVSTSTKKFGTGSLKLDGSGDFLTAAGITLGNTFTVEAWVYFTSLPFGANAAWLTDFRAGNSSNYTFGIYGGGTLYYYAAGTALNGNVAVTTNTWNHIAYVNDGGNFSAYLNGSRCGTATFSYSQGSATAVIGARHTQASEFIAGYIDDLRISTVARYSGSTITVPTSAFLDS